MARFTLRANRAESAIRTLQKRIATAQKRVNGEAASQMKAGRYDAAKTLMQVGSSLADFVKDTEALSQSWKDFTTRTAADLEPFGINVVVAGRSRSITSPVALCKPALQAVLTKGPSEMGAVIAELEGRMTLTEKDRVLVSGIPRWHAAVERAYLNSQRHGWIEKRKDGLWKLTSKGRDAATDSAR